MSLRLLVDEDTQAKWLVALLRRAGHDVVTVSEAGLEAEEDITILDYARQEHRVILTYNSKDFEALHLADPDHPGIAAIYRGDDASKNMSYHSVAKALANLDASGLDLAGQFLPLNAWSY